MADPKQAVIDELLAHLEDLAHDMADTKRTINSLLRRMGQPVKFKDVEPEAIGGGSATFRPDQFFGKPLSTAAREVIEARGQAITALDVLSALEQGGFDFDATGWKKNDRLRSLSITLTKNSQTFVKLPSGTFGLRAMYPNLPSAPTRKPKDNGSDADEPEMDPEEKE